MRDALFIARNDLAQMLRARETLLWVFVMPALFFYFIGTVTGGYARPRGAQPDPILVEMPGPQPGFMADALGARLEAQNYRLVRDAAPEIAARTTRRLRIQLPDGFEGGFTDAVLAGARPKAVLELRGDPLRADYDRVRVARAVYGLVADIAVVRSEGAEPSAQSLAGVASRPRALTLAVSSAGRRAEPPSGFSQAVPGILVMFTMLVLLTSGAILLVSERERGLLRRLAATPIARGSIVLGKWLARMALGLVQIAFAMLLGSLFFGVSWGTALPMVAAVLVSWAAFNASLALVLAGVARSASQTAGIGVLATMALAALGGCWWPIEITPQWMQRLALTLPTGWCMDALHRLVNFGYGPESAWPHAVALAAGSLLLGWLGTRLFRYQ
jgi:ABC-2 type transport system permease protein